MTQIFTTILNDRAVLSVKGEDAITLLQGLVSVDCERFDNCDNLFSALLAPQGRIQFDFFIHKSNDGLLIEIDKERADAFLKRLTFYKLRSDVQLKDVSDTNHVVVSWGSDVNGKYDARLPALGSRVIKQGTPEINAKAQDYHAHRIALGIPESGKDFSFDEIFPHDAMMDALGGVDFDKGCFVGQEVVSRVKHRGTARKRFFLVSAKSPLPGPGAIVTAAGKKIGTLGTAVGNNAVALVRVDQLEKADGDISVNGIDVDVRAPEYFVSFDKSRAS